MFYHAKQYRTVQGVKSLCGTGAQRLGGPGVGEGGGGQGGYVCEAEVVARKEKL